MRVAVNVNGVLTDDRGASISVFDHGFLYGEGVYETLRTYKPPPVPPRPTISIACARPAAAIALSVPMDDPGLRRIDSRHDGRGPTGPASAISVFSSRGASVS